MQKQKAVLGPMSTRNVVIGSDFGSIKGGQEKVAIESALGLKSRGFEVTFFCGVRPIDPRLEAAGVHVECLDQKDIANASSKFSAVKMGLWNAHGASRFRELVDRKGAENPIFHFHGWSKCFSPSVMKSVYGSGLRNTFTMHEYFLACPNGGFYDYKRGEICHRKPLSASCLSCNCDKNGYVEKSFRVLRQMALIQLSKCPANMRDIIYLTEFQRMVAAAHLPSTTRLHKLSNPVSVSRSDRIKAELNHPFVFTGRLVEVKGACLFAESALKAKRKAIFIGDGPERSRIEAMSKSFSFSGWLDDQAIQMKFRQARALVFPSLWYECQPLVPYEALASGLPVITFDISAASEAIIHGETGLVVRAADGANGLADALALLDDPEVVRKLSVNAYERYWDNPLTMDRHLDNLEEIYLRL